MQLRGLEGGVGGTVSRSGPMTALELPVLSPEISFSCVCVCVVL